MSIHELTTWQWLILGVAAFLVGVSKTGVSGLGILAVAVFANAIPSTKAASGMMLPLLISGDLLAFALYRQHAQWRHLVRLAPWTALGVVLGWWVLGAWDDHLVKVLVGVLVVALVSLQIVRQKLKPSEAGAATPAVWLWALVLGVLIGFSTMVANAAGPLMAVYLLLVHLPKYEFMGTSAVFFMVLNWVKVPFSVNLGLINPASLWIDLPLVPVVVAGALLGKALLKHIDQKTFERLALALGLAAGLKLCFL